ncbi:DUF7670 domain-containing protein [Mariniplasma anaerobium]|uniref:DUF7670 domain-containing protein n=1 Tax=Mariniplasma anaerobium TaxID=2735436 RepID=A0A7U9TJV0_9MOLU|nr:hypothetical protein [Mariniplasma anaerobium]BCR36189.1 hypothetical protein MPAN_010820 [Mariniplasma anaerobium]
MTKIINVLKIYMIIISLLFVMFAFNVFGSTEGNITNEILGLLISILPGLFLLLTTMICWHKERILSYFIGIMAIIFFIFFKMYYIFDSLEIIVLIFIPMASLSILLFIDSKNINTYS